MANIREAPGLLFNGPPFPVGDRCPQCGGAADWRMRAHPWIWWGLWRDRACTRCLMGFRPARPLWVKGLYLASLLSLATLVILPAWNPPWLDTVWLPAAFLAANVLLLITQLRD